MTYRFNAAQIIAARTLSRPYAEIVASVCRPLPMGNPPWDWSCSFRIDGLTKDP